MSPLQVSSFSLQPSAFHKSLLALPGKRGKEERMSQNEFSGVTAVAKANVYFDGKVVSHTLIFPDNTKKTLGLIYPGKFHFGTAASELMEIVAGACRVKLDGSNDWADYTAGQAFTVPANSGFDIEIASGICEYICSFLS